MHVSPKSKCELQRLHHPWLHSPAVNCFAGLPPYNAPSLILYFHHLTRFSMCDSPTRCGRHISSYVLRCLGSWDARKNRDGSQIRSMPQCVSGLSQEVGILKQRIQYVLEMSHSRC